MVVSRAERHSGDSEQRRQSQQVEVAADGELDVQW